MTRFTVAGSISSAILAAALCARAEAMIVNLEFTPSQLSATLFVWGSADTDTTVLSGNVQVELPLGFSPEGPCSGLIDPSIPKVCKLDWLQISGGAWSIEDMAFQLPVSPLDTLLARTENVGGGLYGFTPVTGRGGGLFQPPVYPHPVSFPASNVGAMIDVGKYEYWYQGIPESRTEYDFAVAPVPAVIPSGTGELDVSLMSFDDQIATYQVTAEIPLDLFVPVDIFSGLRLAGTVHAEGGFVRDLTEPREPAMWIKGDENGDGSVDDWDLNLWLSELDGPLNPPEQSELSGLLYYFDHTSTMGQDSASAVPEPATFLLAAIGLLGLLGFAWRRRGRA